MDVQDVSEGRSGEFWPVIVPVKQIGVTLT